MNMNAGKKIFLQRSLFSSFIHCFTFYAVNCEYLRNANINILSVYGNRLLKKYKSYLSSHLCSSVDFSLLSVNGWSHPLRRIRRRELKNMLILAIEQMFAMYCLLSRKNIFGSSSLSNSCIVNWTEWMSPSVDLAYTCRWSK